jgi:HEAT repeat protein
VTIVEPDLSDPDFMAPSNTPKMGRTLVAVLIGLLVLAATGGITIGVCANWTQLTAYLGDSPADKTNEDYARRAGPGQTPAPSPPPAEENNQEQQTTLPPAPDRVASSVPEEKENEEPPPAGAAVAKPANETGEARPLGVGKLVVKHRKDLSEDDLRKQLLWAPELGMTPVHGAPIAEAFFARVATAKTESTELNMEPTYITARLHDFRTLPMRRGLANRIDARATRELHYLGRELHLLLDRLAAKDGENRPSTVLLGEFMKQEVRRDNKATWLRPEAVPTLQQVLGHEDLPVRLLLVDLLTRIDGRAASLALAQHAIFDLAPAVREAAIHGLDRRPRDEYRSALAAALRYPWAAAADHAAEALAALQDREAVPLLVRLLKEPDPAAPVAKKDHVSKREVVRINHADNCLACHPPAWLGNDPVQRAVPGFTVVNNSTVIPTSSLSIPSQTVIESGGTVTAPSIRPADRGGSGGYPHGPTTTTTSATSLNVRGDITYLRQDFSIQQPVRAPLAGQSVKLRFDYVVRRRPLTEKQTQEWKTQPNRPVGYEQREAVLFALRELTGQDAGPTSEAWEKLYPASDFESWTAQLTTALVGAPDYKKAAVIKKLREAKGVAYTEALAQAIPQLSGWYQDKARTALVERMKRMSRTTLRNKLGDENREVRSAALSAIGWKEETSLIPDVMALLADPEPAVAEAAEAALKALRTREAGPEGGAE